MRRTNVISLALFRARRAAEERLRQARATPPDDTANADHRRLWTESLDRLARYLRQLTEETAMTKFDIEAPADTPVIIMSRVINAPQALVWKAWTQKEHFAVWWGPHGSSNTVIDFDFRPEGKWRVRQATNHDSEVTFYGRFLVVEPTSRFVWTFGVADMFEDTGTEEHNFIDQGETTLLRTVSTFGDIASRDGLLSSGMEHGANESMERLEALLATMR